MFRPEHTPRVGTAAWSLPADVRGRFSGTGSLLERYARVLDAVEINSSFYRDHRPETYRRWAESVPGHFRFSVKLARRFTHESGLHVDGTELSDCLRDIAELGAKWGVLLVQLPARLAFEAGDASRFLVGLREAFAGTIAWEPRHRSWASPKAIELLDRHQVCATAADPDRWGLDPKDAARLARHGRYFRLHGSPVIYESDYPSDFLARLSDELLTRSSPGSARASWCIFDNTKWGHATRNALWVRDRLFSEEVLGGLARGSRGSDAPGTRSTPGPNGHGREVHR